MQGSPKTLLSAKTLQDERPRQALCTIDADAEAWQLALIEKLPAPLLIGVPYEAKATLAMDAEAPQVRERVPDSGTVP